MPSEDAKDPKTIETVTVTSLAELRAALQAGGQIVASEIPWRRVWGRWHLQFRSATVQPVPKHEGEGT